MTDRTLRTAAGYGGIAFAAVYLGLKALWIAGVPFGISAELLAQDGQIPANLVTAGMAVVGVLVLWAFSRPWGRKAPGWLVLVPTWVGTGLLVPAALALAVTALLALTGLAPWPAVDNGAASWLQPVVYSCFTGLGACLAIAFVGHVKERWPSVLRDDASVESPTRPIQLPLAWAGVLLAVGPILVRLQWGLGGSAGLDPANVADRPSSWYVVHVVHALLTLAGAAALLHLLHRRPARRSGRSMALAWTGTGMLFGSGVTDYGLGLLMRPTDVWRMPEAETVLAGVQFAELLAGVALGFAALLLAVDRAYAPAAGSSGSRWTMSGPNAGRQTATYSAPSGPGVE